MKLFFLFVWCGFFLNGVSDAMHDVLKMEGESVTLNTSIIKVQQERLKWYFNGIRIAELTGNNTKICVDDQCKETFTGRLKLDNQTGSLTITNSRTTDSGVYELQINSGKREERFNLTIRGSLGADTSGFTVFVVDGDSVTLQTGVQTNPNDRIKWYFNKNRIAEFVANQSKVCKDIKCQERFRERLDLNKQTGSLTIKNIATTDSGDYQLEILNRKIEKSFYVTVVELDRQKSVMEKKSVILEALNETTSNDVIKWFFDKVLIATLIGDQIQICAEIQGKDWKEGLRDRLKLEDQTGSLTITGITVKDYGEYTLQINRTAFSINRSFTVMVIAVSSSGLNPSAIGGICAFLVVLLVLILVIVGVFCCCKKNAGTQAYQNNSENINMVSTNQQDGYQNSSNQAPESCHNHTQIANETSYNQDDALLGNSVNSANMTFDSHNPAQTANETSHDRDTSIPYIDDSENEDASDNITYTKHNKTEGACVTKMETVDHLPEVD